MKTLKLILSNLILVLMLVILTSGTVCAKEVIKPWSFKVTADLDENGDIKSYNLTIYKLEEIRAGIYDSEKIEKALGVDDFSTFDVEVKVESGMYIGFDQELIAYEYGSVCNDVEITHDGTVFKIIGKDGFFKDFPKTKISIRLDCVTNERS